MHIEFDLPEDIAAAMPWRDVPGHIMENIALEGYKGGWLSEAQIQRLLGYETPMEVHGFLKAHQLYAQYGNQELQEDAKTHERLGF